MWRIMAIFMIVLTPLGVKAQEQKSWWEDGCDARAVALIEPTQGNLNYGAACESYRACDPSGEGSSTCQMVGFKVLLDQCAADDPVCPKTAGLYAAALLAFDMPFGESVDWRPPSTVIDGVPKGLAAFQAGDYEAAMAAFSLTTPEDFFGDSSLPIMRAITAEMLGDSAGAIVEYDSIFDAEFVQPLASYMRAQLYGSLGRNVEASFDAETIALSLNDKPELTDLVETLKSQYPLDDRMKSWLMYPVTSASYGVGGAFVDDLSLQPSRSVRVGFYNELDSLVVIGVSSLLSGSPDENYQLVQILRNNGEDHYLLGYPSYWENSGSLDIHWENGAFKGSESISYFEGAAGFEFILAPENNPDPRDNLIGQRYCAGGVRSRLHIGITAITPWASGDPVQLFNAAGGASIVGGGQTLTILNGPQCIGTTIWWQAQDEDGNLGWLPENEDTSYSVNPGQNAPVTNDCPLAAWLHVGVSGRVVPGLGANNLRQQPTLDSIQSGEIPEDGVFSVLDGPVCNDGMLWWLVNYQGSIGWTAEGQNDTYWLAPLD